MPNSTEVARQFAHEQALANTHIEGHIPTSEFIADCEAVTSGLMTRERARANSLARALGKARSTTVADAA